MKALKIALFGKAVAVGGVLGATTGSEDTGAAICCSRCYPNLKTCMNNCAGNIDCQMLCDERYMMCNDSCSPSC